MVSLLSTFQEQVQTILFRLQEAEARETDPASRYEAGIRICYDYIVQLKQWVTEHPFPDKECEIYFFKQVKPVVMARYIYYQRIYHLHLGYFNGSGLLEKDRLERELREIERYFKDNQEFYTYYRSGSALHDELYFVRGNNGWKNWPEGNHFDDVFSTGRDGKLAELMANELLLKYVDEQLRPTDSFIDPASANTVAARSATSSRLKCTATLTDIVELVYALQGSGFFNNGNASVKEVAAFFVNALKVDIRDHSHLFHRLRIRKNPTKFLDKLKSAFQQRIDSMDE